MYKLIMHSTGLVYNRSTLSVPASLFTLFIVYGFWMLEAAVLFLLIGQQPVCVGVHLRLACRHLPLKTHPKKKKKIWAAVLRWNVRFRVSENEAFVSGRTRGKKPAVWRVSSTLRAFRTAGFAAVWSSRVKNGARVRLQSFFILHSHLCMKKNTTMLCERNTR